MLAQNSLNWHYPINKKLTMHYKFFFVSFFSTLSLLSPGSFLPHKTQGQKAVAANPPGGLSLSHAAEDKKRKERVDAINLQLKELGGDFNRQARKEIITRAVMDEGIHPDALKDGDVNVLYDTLFANYQKDDSDFAFTRLLLENGADANASHKNLGPFLKNASTVRVAQLLFDYGAQNTVLKCGAELLQHASSDYDSSLTQRYIDWGVNVNALHDGKTPLFSLVFYCDGYRSNFKDHHERLRVLMNAGALLSISINHDGHCRDGYTAPQSLKKSIEGQEIDLKKTTKEYIEIPEKRLALLVQMRTILIEFSNYRHNGLEIDLISLEIPKVLAKLIVEYYIAQEPHYLKLEAMPTPVPKSSLSPKNGGIHWDSWVISDF